MEYFTCLQKVDGVVQGLILEQRVAELSGLPRTQQCVQ